jgi:hypothetical protein
LLPAPLPGPPARPARASWQADIPPWLAVDRAAQVVWKGHVLIAAELETILTQCLWHPVYLAPVHLRFLQKAALVRAMAPEQHAAREWDLLDRLNALRNELSHVCHPEKRRQKTRRVLVCLAGLDPATEPTAPEAVLLARAVAVVLDFLRTQAAQEAPPHA